MWIETVDGLTEEQQAIVDAAVAVAGVPVHVAPCLGPGPEFPPLPVRRVEWIPVSVGVDARSLRVHYCSEGGIVESPAMSLLESATEIEKRRSA